MRGSLCIYFGSYGCTSLSSCGIIASTAAVNSGSISVARESVSAMLTSVRSIGFAEHVFMVIPPSNSALVRAEFFCLFVWNVYEGITAGGTYVFVGRNRVPLTV